MSMAQWWLKHGESSTTGTAVCADSVTQGRTQDNSYAETERPRQGPCQ